MINIKTWPATSTKTKLPYSFFIASFIKKWQIGHNSKKPGEHIKWCLGMSCLNIQKTLTFSVVSHILSAWLHPQFIPLALPWFSCSTSTHFISHICIFYGPSLILSSFNIFVLHEQIEKHCLFTSFSKRRYCIRVNLKVLGPILKTISIFSTISIIRSHFWTMACTKWR